MQLCNCVYMYILICVCVCVCWSTFGDFRLRFLFWGSLANEERLRCHLMEWLNCPSSSALHYGAGDSQLWFVMICDDFSILKRRTSNGTVGFKEINGFQEHQWCSSLRPWFSCAQAPAMEGPKMPTLVRTPMATIRPRSPRPSPCCGEVHEAWNIVNMLIQC